MSEQRLILPIDSLRLTAGYKNAAYRKRFNYTHYGFDCVSGSSERAVHSLGNGIVVAAGNDGGSITGQGSRLGRVAVVVYRNVRLSDGRLCDLACRMYHFDSLAVKPGDTLKSGDIIGDYGTTGAMVTGAHLHIEFDTDFKYPCYAYGVGSGGRLIQRGTRDTSVSPAGVWYRALGQRLTGSGDEYTTAADTFCPPLPEDFDWQKKYSELAERVRALASSL